MFLQPTSPIRDQKDIDKALTYFRKKFDTLFSYKDKSLFWIRKGNKLKPINYTPKKRQRNKTRTISILKMDPFIYLIEKNFETTNKIIW